MGLPMAAGLGAERGFGVMGAPHGSGVRGLSRDMGAPPWQWGQGLSGDLGRWEPPHGSVCIGCVFIQLAVTTNMLNMLKYTQFSSFFLDTAGSSPCYSGVK